jgi:hypothetical protein
VIDDPLRSTSSKLVADRKPDEDRQEDQNMKHHPTTNTVIDLGP